MPNPLAINVEIKSETVNKALDLIAQAGYVLYEPTKVKRKAKAEVEAALIKAEGEITVTKLQRQAFNRLVARETVRQKNINQVTEKALQDLKKSGMSVDNATDVDWIRKYFDFSQDISNETMQSIWSKVLSGEFIKAGSFSYKTMSILANLRQADAELFSKLCSYVIIMHGGRKVPLIFSDGADGKYSDNTFTFEDLQHLESIGLIHFNSISNFKLTVSSARTIPFDCAGKTYVITTEEDKIDLGVGDILFTREGQELFEVLDVNPSDHLIKIVTKKWVTGNRSIVELTKN